MKIANWKEKRKLLDEKNYIREIILSNHDNVWYYINR